MWLGFKKLILDLLLLNKRPLTRPAQLCSSRLRQISYNKIVMNVQKSFITMKYRVLALWDFFS